LTTRASASRQGLIILCSMILLLLAGCTIQLPGDHPDPAPPLPGPIGPVNQRPIPLFEISSRTPYTEEVVIFDATLARDEDGWIVSYLWDLGPTGVQTGSIVGTIYHDVGRYLISLTVTDNEGATATREHLLTVQEKDPCNGGGCSGGTCH